jgi:hypothetical protein
MRGIIIESWEELVTKKDRLEMLLRICNPVIQIGKEKQVSLSLSLYLSVILTNYLSESLIQMLFLSFILPFLKKSL